MADPDFAAWAKTRPWWPAAAILVMTGAARVVSVRDAEMPPWPNSVILTCAGYDGKISIDRQRAGWTLTVRSTWEERHG